MVRGARSGNRKLYGQGARCSAGGGREGVGEHLMRGGFEAGERYGGSDILVIVHRGRRW